MAVSRVRLVFAVLLVCGVLSGAAVAAPIAAAQEEPGAEMPMMGANPLGGVPCYEWWYGCSPTSGGMMVGYWDAHGFPNLYDGDASAETVGTRDMIASLAHRTAGSENSYTYGDWHNSTSYPTHEANPDCIADFMHTVNGGTWTSGIVTGLESYIEWDGSAYGDPNHVTKDAYPATVAVEDVPYYGGAWSYDDFKAEIDAGRPVLLDVVCTPTLNGDMIGHSVVGYGYQDDMFQIMLPTPGTPVVSAGGFAIMDTWDCTPPPSTTQSEWVGPGLSTVLPQVDANNVEWWPYVDYQGYYWYYNSGNPLFDWYIAEGITVQLDTDLIPEPATLTLLIGGGLLALVRRRRRK